MIGRADIEGSKSNVAMNAWLPQASYPCGNFSDTSSFKFRRSKGSIGHAFTVRIRTGNQNQTSFYPFVPHEISVLVELILGHLRYLLTDVPPQPNSPPDNVFRPDRPPKRPWVQKEGQRPASDSRNNHFTVGLESSSTGSSFPADSAKPVPLAVVSLDSRQGQWESHDEAFGYLKRVIVTPAVTRAWLNFFTLTFRALGRNHIARLFDARGRPRKGRSQSVPGRHATTRSRRGSSSSSPPTADGFGTGTPEPSPQSQSFRGYGSILPTSLAYIVPSTRGCSPWRPDAVMSTTGRGRHSVLRIFKGRRGRTGHHATCGALPAAGPYLRLSRFQEKITLPEAPADVSGLPNVAVSRHVPDRLTHVQVPFTWNLSPLRPSKFSFEYLLLPPRSAPTALRPARALGFAATAAPSYSSGPGACPDGRVSAQLGTVTRLPVHPASPVLLTKNGPLGALDSVARLNEAAAPSYLFKSFAPIPKSDERFARQYRCGPPPEFPLASPRSGIVHHLSGPDRHALTRTLLRRSRSVGGATLEGIPPTPWSVFQDGTNGEPTGRCPERACAGARRDGARCSPRSQRRHLHRRFKGPGLGRHRDPHRSTPRADRRTGCRRSTSDRGASRPHPLPSRQFQALFDSLFKVLFIFPSRYLFAIGLSPIFSLGRNLPPDWGCIPKQPDSQTAPRGAAGSSHDGALTLSGAPFQGTWAWSAAEDASPDYNSNAAGARFSSWAFPGSLAVTRGILPMLGGPEVPGRQARDRVEGLSTTACRGNRRRGLDFRPTTGGSARETSIRPRPREPRGVGATMRDTQADVPSTRRPRAQLAFKDSMVHGILQFTPSIAFRYVLHRCESRDIRCRESFRLSQKEGAPRHRGYEGGLLVLNFLGASRAGVRWRAVSGADASLHGTRFDNDPSAGSPTETLLRLLLPLNDKVQWTSRDVASGEPPTSPRSEHFTGPFNRPVIASNFLGLEGHSPSKKLAAEGHLRIAS
uniref:Senescence-associated protein n=1 Tax=Salix viminalis TaxID=40686 RepID=A0A6N2MTU4_SALVM